MVITKILLAEIPGMPTSKHGAEPCHREALVTCRGAVEEKIVLPA